MKELFSRDTESINEWWKPRAIERYKKLKSGGNLKREVHLYNNMIGLTYEQAKESYFKEVGR
jgi:hypothetical protein